MGKIITHLVPFYRLFQWRVFWSVSLVERADGYFYHRWHNWILNDDHYIFAGYTHKALNRESTTFPLAIYAYKGRWEGYLADN